ncbi:hypothetical protein ACFLVN_02110 [Chloroflexota bacterium]
MKKLYKLALPLVLVITLISSSALVFAAAPFGMTNEGFETGDFTGWTVDEGFSGDASVVTSFYASYVPTTVYPYCGEYFAVLENGAEDEDTSISQDFTISAGETIEGWAFFYTTEWFEEPDYNDECSVDIMDGATLVDRVFFADTWDAQYPLTPWTYWSWTAPSSGTYTLVARVVNILDSGAPSYIGLDICEAELIPVTIDIKPCSDPNSINLKSKGVLPVAILTTDTFDAMEVDFTTVQLTGTLGSAGAIKAEVMDVCPYDGDVDMVVYFSTQDLRDVLDPSDEVATLTGETIDGTAIEGMDSVRIVKY